MEKAKTRYADLSALTELVPEILQMVDERQIAFRPAVEISYLSEEQQYTLFRSDGLQRCHPLTCTGYQNEKVYDSSCDMCVALSDAHH